MTSGFPHRVEHHDASGLLPRGDRDRATGGGAVRRDRSTQRAPRGDAAPRFRRIPLPCKLGYRTVYAPRCARSRSSTRATSATSTSTARGSCQAPLGDRPRRRRRAALRHLNVDHPLHRAATTGGGLSRQRMARRMTCWERTLPPTFDEFLVAVEVDADRRHSLHEEARPGLRRSPRDAQVPNPDELDGYFRDAGSLRRSRPARLGAGVRDDPRQRRRATTRDDGARLVPGTHALPRRSSDRILRRRGFRERFRYGIPAYDPEYADYRVGNYVLMKLIEDVCDDPELTLLDFGFEDADLRRRFACRAGSRKTS